MKVRDAGELDGHGGAVRFGLKAGQSDAQLGYPPPGLRELVTTGNSRDKLDRNLYCRGKISVSSHVRQRF